MKDAHIPTCGRTHALHRPGGLETGCEKQESSTPEKEQCRCRSRRQGPTESAERGLTLGPELPAVQEGAVTIRVLITTKEDTL